MVHDVDAFPVPQEVATLRDRVEFRVVEFSNNVVVIVLKENPVGVGLLGAKIALFRSRIAA